MAIIFSINDKNSKFMIGMIYILSHKHNKYIYNLQTSMLIRSVAK